MGKWMDGRRLRLRALPLVACLLTAMAAVALAGGCGDSSEKSDTPRRVVQVQSLARDRWTYARERFNEMCAGCHTLADAGARGRRFNLDHTGDISEDRARFAIAEGEPGMPAFRHVLSRREYEELVAYVSSVDLHEPGDDYWHWQIRLRMAGDAWRPEDGRKVIYPPGNGELDGPVRAADQLRDRE